MKMVVRWIGAEAVVLSASINVLRMGRVVVATEVEVHKLEAGLQLLELWVLVVVEEQAQGLESGG
jgi:hypothetical protein